MVVIVIWAWEEDQGWTLLTAQVKMDPQHDGVWERHSPDSPTVRGASPS